MKKNDLSFFGFIFYYDNGLLGADSAVNATDNFVGDGLKDNVTVRRDERGIPYIEARNEADLFFAQGFVTAQDRLWQMDLYRR
jgi:acyl-homoserine lactone acylase PvdQ